MNKLFINLLFGATLLASSACSPVAFASELSGLDTHQQSHSIKLPTQPLIDQPNGDIDPDSEIGQIQQSAAKSDAVVMGRVLSKKSTWIGKVIVTTATIDVLETMKGKTNRQVQVSYPGGVIGPIAQYVTHTPALNVDEVAVLFISEPQSEALKKMDSFEFSTEKSKVAILAPEQDESRLEENVRLTRHLNRIRAAVK
ncbi:hypothetical protein NBRC116583_16580 [Arenicella sp. 4NH20-0111]|uniref:hypothetical protein n=1 Tax=Arenicella sp. 4NH20-0111 TaxID=3127648 RepID=UPI0031065ACF